MLVYKHIGSRLLCHATLLSNEGSDNLITSIILVYAVKNKSGICATLAILMILMLAACVPASATRQFTTATPDWQATVATLEKNVTSGEATAATLRTQVARALTPSPTATPLPTPTGAVTDDGQRMDDYLRQLTVSGEFSGAVLVAQHGRVILRAGYAMANADYQLPNTPQTRFRLGSITKQFTAMAILILEQRGQLNVDAPICRYLSDCPPDWQPITIHQLLTHTSGIPNYTQTNDFAGREPWTTTPEEIVNWVRDQPLLFAPGAGYNYSNANYVLLGLIIERASGQSYAAFLQTTIFAPLRLNDTGLDLARTVVPNRATGYLTATTEATYLDLSTLFAAGDLSSTVDDLYLWDRALYTDTLIPAELRKRMFTPVRETYAYGWRVTESFGKRMVGHTGAVSGFHNYITRYIDDDTVVIVLSNFEKADVEVISLQLAAFLFDLPVPTPAPDAAMPTASDVQ